jgi:hypothetical protein
MQLPPHATAARSSPLFHHHRHLRPRHTTACWSGPCPLPPTGWCTDRWIPLTSMPLHGVVGVGHVPFMVGVAPTGLHRTKGPCHRAVKGRKLEEKKRTTRAASRWSPACRGAGDLPDGTHLHRSTGSTPRATRATDRNHTADPSHASVATTDASITRSRPIRLWYASGSVECMRQPGAPVVHPLHRLV